MITTTISDPESSRPRTLALGFCHRPRRGIAATRTHLLTVAWIAMFGFAPRQSSAALIYTWNEEDGQVITGSLAVDQAAQQAGVIQYSDVLNYAFSIPSLGLTFSTTDLAASPPLYDQSSFPISISTSSAIPTQQEWPTLVCLGSYDRGVYSSLYVPFGWDVFTPNLPAPEWAVGFTTGGWAVSGEGYWTVSGVTTTTPEPSSLFMAGLACSFGIAYGAARKRRATRIHTNGA